MNTISLCAVCSFGLESILKREIIRLGFPVKKVENGKVYYSGDDIHAVALSNLYLRTADRVFLKIGEFDADSFDSLYEGILQIPFEEYVPADGRFDIYKINSVRSKLYSKSDCQAIVKKAVAQRLQKCTGFACCRKPVLLTPSLFILPMTMQKYFSTLPAPASTGAAIDRRAMKRLSKKPWRLQWCCYPIIAPKNIGGCYVRFRDYPH